jgi:hypothetical protein
MKITHKIIVSYTNPSKKPEAMSRGAKPTSWMRMPSLSGKRTIILAVW